MATITTTEQRIALRFVALNVTQAWLCSPIEDDRDQLVVVVLSCCSQRAP